MIRAYKGSTVTQRANSKGKDLHPNREGNGTARQELRKKGKNHTADRAAYSTGHKDGYTHLDLRQPISGPEGPANWTNGNVCLVCYVKKVPRALSGPTRIMS